ncbi:mandelate racemase/muconate lactonizing enzyme family protein [Solicola gregarius]|uniref:Mandelate racemase/muconate lactonizing enzyme family protein n=1 Tax=Solicola gregarius TaxID=2908642 RepID=A0AA46THM2_9ACTN|nr:mandelate racemase/muconate lactonizing enzyme family protein [Solicola gregarius]UYM04673.1 mandelate racemase/muconate lactonizing enzyme family protein [Solicola gregarius]
MSVALPVERVRVSVLRASIDDAVPMSFGRLDARQTCLVEVLAGGLTGVGESWINYPGWAPAERLATLSMGVAPLVIGADAADPEAVLETLTRELLPIGRQWGAPGPIWQAISAIDIALWDLAGRAAGTPVCDLLAGGAATRASVPAYASGVGPTDVALLCERALEQGFGAVKTKIGFGHDRDIATLGEARSVLGSSHGLFADANQAWTMDDALAMLPALDEHGVGWLEEPLAGNHVDDLEKLAAATPVPIATGENLYGLGEFETYASSPAVGILQPDLAKSGGLTIARQVARVAAESATRLAPHCYSSAVGLVASAHLGAAFDVVDWLEVDVRDNPLRTELLSTPLGWHDGALPPPRGPGLGIELDESTVRHFRTHVEEIS